MKRKPSKDIEISKSVMPSLPNEYEQTNLGDARGARKQYRRALVHVREYDNRFLVHEDKFNPQKNPISHLVVDSPETLLAFGATVAALFSNSCDRDFSKKEGGGEQNNNNALSYSSMMTNPIFFFLAFLSINRILGSLKHLLFG